MAIPRRPVPPPELESTMPPMPLTPPTQRNTDNDSLEVTPQNPSQPPTNPATPPADEPKVGEAPPAPTQAAVPSATPAHQDVVAPPVPTPSLAPPAATPAAPINHSPAVWTPQVSPVAPNLPSVSYVCPPLPAPTPNYLPQLLPNYQVPNAVEHRGYTPQNPTFNRATSPPTSRWRYGKQAVRGY